MDGYIGVNGKARKIKGIWVGVDGKARSVKNAYVGVDGKARRWFAAAEEQCQIYANITYQYSREDIFALLVVAPDTTDEQTIPLGLLLAECYLNVSRGTIISVGYNDFNPYGPMTFEVYLDGNRLPLESDTMSIPFQVNGDIEIEYVFNSTGGSMPMNSMMINATHLN